MRRDAAGGARRARRRPVSRCLRQRRPLTRAGQAIAVLVEGPERRTLRKKLLHLRTVITPTLQFFTKAHLPNLLRRKNTQVRICNAQTIFSNTTPSKANSFIKKFLARQVNYSPLIKVAYRSSIPIANRALGIHL